MKKNIIAIFLIFSMLMSFAACRKLDESGAFVIESKVFVVGDDGVEHNVQSAVNANGEEEFFYYDAFGNKVVVKEKDVVVKTTRVAATTQELPFNYDELSPEEQSFVDSFNDPEAFDELIDSSIVEPELEFSELLPEDSFEEIEVEIGNDGKPVHDDIKQTYEELVKSNRFTMDFNIKGDMNGTDTVVPIVAMRDGDQVYFKVIMPVDNKGSMEFNCIIKNKQCYLIIPSMRAYLVVPAESMSEFIPSDLITESENNMKYLYTAEVDYEGESYMCDVYEDAQGGATVKYYYKDGELKRMENIVDETNSTIIEINEISSRVDSSKFKVPKNYIDMTKIMGSNFDFSSLTQ
ncbi:MAG: hypothetical protein IJ264_01580 [Clostridia bacterium]|nr:hypothetical protein [Clostridia bacterium]